MPYRWQLRWIKRPKHPAAVRSHQSMLADYRATFANPGSNEDPVQLADNKLNRCVEDQMHGDGLGIVEVRLNS